MNRRTLFTGWLIALALALAGCDSGGGDSSSGAGDGQASGSLTPEAQKALSSALLDDEGEYAAYAAYTSVIERYGNVEPYVTIRRAESRHISALQRVMDRYGVSYSKQNPFLGKIRAPDSLLTAARAWEKGEIANVQLYDGLLSSVRDYPDLTRMFNNLRAASLNQHLPAFRAAAQNGGTLTPDQMRQVNRG
ncbi:MAG: DUF2202 domain-containing protein [Pseudomonadota bacterium]|nr:DUF2202 domain-containing protein [Pseudomonadota bacterium]